MDYLDKELEDLGYQFEFEYGDYDYSWTITRVYTKDGHVFDLTDSGCSCSYFGEYFTDVNTAIGDMYEVTSLPELEFSGDDVRGRYHALGVR